MDVVLGNGNYLIVRGEIVKGILIIFDISDIHLIYDLVYTNFVHLINSVGKDPGI